MAISYVGSAAANATSLTMPSHQKGDLLVGIAYRHDSVGPPANPSGWLSRHSFGHNSNASCIAFKTAQSDSEVSGIWANATQLIIGVYRSTSGLYLMSGALASSGGLAAANIVYPANPLIYNAGSWVIGYSGTRTDDAGNNPPAGMVNRISTVATGELSLHDTNGVVSSFPLTNVATSSVTFRGITCEIYETDVLIGGASIPSVSAWAY